MEKTFIQEHAGDDPEQLLLNASRYPAVDIPFVAMQIAARRQIRDKLPSWFANADLVFPSKIAAEQCSSELTATYKQRFVNEGERLCDLTGGLGIDSYFFSRKAEQVVYIERLPAYCTAARQNFDCLAAGNIEVVEGDAAELFPRLPTPIDVFYIDPARRGEGNKRMFALSDCEPDLPALLPALWNVAPRVIAKLSPMADLRQTLRLLPATTEIHVLSVQNDCKEVVFVMERNASVSSPIVHCVHLLGGREDVFTFDLQEEKELEILPTQKVQTYLYEPNASILKAGAFKSITRLGVGKLHPSSHLYTSPTLCENFPGRTFTVESVLPFSSKLCKTLRRTIDQAHIATRNFPLTAEALRRRTQLADGGDTYLFATTLADNRKALIVCRKYIFPPIEHRGDGFFET